MESFAFSPNFNVRFICVLIASVSFNVNCSEQHLLTGGSNNFWMHEDMDMGMGKKRL